MYVHWYLREVITAAIDINVGVENQNNPLCPNKQEDIHNMFLFFSNYGRHQMLVQYIEKILVMQYIEKKHLGILIQICHQ